MPMKFLISILLFSIFGPILGAILFLSYFSLMAGFNAFNPPVLAATFIGTLIIGVVPAILASMFFYPTFVLMERKFFSRYKLTYAKLGAISGGVAGFVGSVMFIAAALIFSETSSRTTVGSSGLIFLSTISGLLIGVLIAANMDKDSSSKATAN